MGSTASRPERRSWRYSRAGALLGSYDFYLGIPLAVAVAIAIAQSKDAREAAAGLLIGVAGVCGAIATLVLTSLTVLLSSLSSEHLALLKKTTNGVRGVAEPYQIVIGLAAVGTVAATAASFIFPLTIHSAAHHLHWLSFVAALVPLGCCFWSALGCIQLTAEHIRQWERSQRASEIAERRRAAEQLPQGE